MSVRNDIGKLHLPEVLDGVTSAADWEVRRQEIVALLAQEEYGPIPDFPCEITYEVGPNERYGGGSADYYQVTITVTTPRGSHAFPLSCVIPRAGRPCPAFVHVNFRGGVPDSYMPSEEISDNGFACFSFCYNDVTMDNADFTDGLAGLVYPDGVRGPHDPGKISLWAWAAMRAMDYIATLPAIDQKNIGIIGHSRLGKTAIWTAANDLRYSFVFANQSGCCGAALTRGAPEDAEHIDQICKTFPYWLCENYKKYVGHIEELPFDQHWLLATIAPRRLYVSSAEEDRWTGPDSQYRACVETAKVWEALGCVPGFTGPDAYPGGNDAFQEGYIAYHSRTGDHFLSRRDWLQFMKYFKKYRNQ
ncbi:MAG: hypothetical protein E7458_04745 [Ruminococcaceae bacterium]|nr:hypothetical protein [Oscillospiraceae bacterium]